VDDLAEGGLGLPPTDGLRYRLGKEARVVIRPSGTEPKLKCYLEVVMPVPEGGAIPRAEADEALQSLRTDLSTLLGL
jgi:phosphomannomutase